MSIRIYNESLSGAAASQTSRADELSRVTGGSRSSQTSAASGEDQVQISSISENIATQAANRAAHVQSLAALYQSGKYQVNYADLAHSLVSNSLQAGGAEGGH